MHRNSQSSPSNKKRTLQKPVIDASKDMVLQKIKLKHKLKSKLAKNINKLNSPIKAVRPGMCPIHGKPLEIYCLTCLEKICTNCALFGDHKGHHIKSEEDVFKFASEKAEKLFKLSEELINVESSLEGRNMLSETEKQLEEVKESFLKEFDLRFNVKHKF